MSIVALALAACGGGGGSTPSSSQSSNPPPSQYTVGGSVTGLSGTGLVLQDNGGDNLAVSASGPFTFATKLNSGAAYSVTVMTQPTGQTCTVASGTGTVTANVTNVAVSCTNTASNVTIGGTVQGLSGTGLVLQDNGGDSLSVTQNGPFTFATALAAGAAYAVTVSTQPSSPTQNCTVTNGTGTTASSNVTTVTVSCTTSAGKFAYTASNSLGKIYGYTIDPNSGALTATPNSPYLDGTAPAAVSLAPNGKFAFSASDNGLKIQAFTIDQTSGALTLVGTYSTGFATGSTFPDIAVDSHSAHLYLASAGDGQVAGFSIDPNSGALTALSGSPYTSGPNASGIPAFSPDGTHLYVVDENATGGVFGYSINADGSLAKIAGSPFTSGPQPYWISFTPNGKFAYVSNSGAATVSAYSVDPTSGALTALATATYPVDGNPKDLTIDPAGTHLYVPLTNGSAAGAVDAFTIGADGSLTKVTGSPWAVGIGPRFVTVDPTGRFAYVASAGTAGTGIYAFSIDATSGALTAIVGSPFDAVTPGTEPQFVTVDPSGKFAYAANEGTGTVSGFTIDQTTGALTAVPNSPYTVGAQPIFVSISPEAPGIRD
jgi:6-phosphogluconolactonase (cycloisomerase 2 family)